MKPETMTRSGSAPALVRHDHLSFHMSIVHHTTIQVHAVVHGAKARMIVSCPCIVACVRTGVV